MTFGEDDLRLFLKYGEEDLMKQRVLFWRNYDLTVVIADYVNNCLKKPEFHSEIFGISEES